MRAPNYLRIILSPFYKIIYNISLISTKIVIDDFTVLRSNIKLSSIGRIIIGAVEIGDNTKIHHNVTIGGGLGVANRKKFPTIGNNVWIGPNTLIHGDITVGEGSVILGDTLLSRTIPPHSLVYGNPPKLLRSNINNSRILNSDKTDINPDNYESWIT
jgi:serine O-acetyltransferase